MQSAILNYQVYILLVFATLLVLMNIMFLVFLHICLCAYLLGRHHYNNSIETLKSIVVSNRLHMIRHVCYYVLPKSTSSSEYYLLLGRRFPFSIIIINIMVYFHLEFFSGTNSTPSIVWFAQ